MTMRILYVAPHYDYGKPEQGLSFEHTNFFDCLHHMGEDILYFDFPTLMQERGRDAMNRRLREVAHAEKPDLMFVFLAGDELDKDTVRAITDSGETTTFNWFADDHFRFPIYSRFWAPCFSYVSTTAESALPGYAALGYDNVIKTQWASNPYSYRRLPVPLKYDVTFVGQPHSNRRAVIGALRDAGIDVQVWGRGWDTGRVTQDGMIALFNESRINLNLTQAPLPTDLTPPAPPPSPARRAVSGALKAVPYNALLKRAVRSGLSAVRRGRENGYAANGAAPLRYEEQIKGRNFEVPGCGGFLLTSPAENLGQYYDVGREIACFGSTDELIDKVRHYLAHEDERAAIADAGGRRTLSEHTYVHRFTEIFARMGLPTRPAADLLSGDVAAGNVEYVT